VGPVAIVTLASSRRVDVDRESALDERECLNDVAAPGR
jgi:hypothetical protein